MEIIDSVQSTASAVLGDTTDGGKVESAEDSKEEEEVSSKAAAGMAACTFR